MIKLGAVFISLILSGATAFAQPATHATVAAAHRATFLTYAEAIQPLTVGQRLTLGIELEGVFPGASREAAFEKLGQLVVTEFRKHIYGGAKIERTNYEFKTRRGEPRQGIKIAVSFANSPKIEEWHLRDDGSIVPPQNYYGVELVTPILRRPNDVEKFRRLEAFLAARGFRAQPDSAALQAHVGFTDNGPLSKTAVTPAPKLAEVLVMILAFSKVEKALMHLFEVNPARQKFTMPAPESIIKAILDGEVPLESTNLYELIQKHYNYRYWALNVHSLFQFGTVEVRFPNSTVDRETTDAFLELSYKLVHAVRSKNPRLYGLIYRYIDEEIPLIELARALDLKIGKMIVRKNCGELLRIAN